MNGKFLPRFHRHICSMSNVFDDNKVFENCSLFIPPFWAILNHWIFRVKMGFEKVKRKVRGGKYMEIHGCLTGGIFTTFTKNLPPRHSAGS